MDINIVYFRHQNNSDLWGYKIKIGLDLVDEEWNIESREQAEVSALEKISNLYRQCEKILGINKD